LGLLLIPQRYSHPAVGSTVFNGERMTTVVEFIGFWLVSFVGGHAVASANCD
jgi:hypothetical protein